MKRSVICVILVLLLLLSGMAAMAAGGLFPSADELFGVTMPDIRFALNRAPDSIETTEEGELLTCRDFTAADYDVFGRYAAAEGLELERSDVLDGVLTAELAKDGKSIRFQYNYGERAASLLYPDGVRREQAKSTLEISKKTSILPDIILTFGTAVPDLSEVLKNHPKPRTVEADGHDEMQYDGISIRDYDEVNAYLTGIGCKSESWRIEGGVLIADLRSGNGGFALRYDPSGNVIAIVCPELYYLRQYNAEQADADLLILPDVNDAFGAMLPRVSTAILRYPDQTSTAEDGSLTETYQNFTEAEYTAFSGYLQTSGCTVGSYYVDPTGALVIPLELKGSGFTFIYDQLGTKATVTYPMGAAIEPEIPQSALPTPEPTPNPTPKPTQKPSQKLVITPETERKCWQAAEQYFRNLSWKNPGSVEIHGYRVSVTDLEEGGALLFSIDYSAQNGFGGYNRKYYFITVDISTCKVKSAFGS